MAFGGKKTVERVSMDRLAAIAGVAPAAAAATAGAGTGSTGGVPRRRVSIEPDMSRIRKNSIDENDEDRRKRMAAKTVNFGATIIARLVILAAAGWYLYNMLEYSGQMHRGLAVGMFAMTADLGRVVLKAMEPGSK